MKVTRLPDGRFALQFSYSPRLIAACKSVPGMTWDPELRAWCGYADAITEIAVSLGGGWGVSLPQGEPIPIYEEHLNGLRGYQCEGVQFMVAAAEEGCLLADVMGAGKTAQAIRAAKALAQKTVVVCPSFVRGVWRDELKKWWPEVHPVGLEGLTAGEITGDNSVIVVHYDILHAWVPELLKWGAQTIIFDECHYLSNEKAQRSKAAKELAHSCKYRIGLSGTPMTNRPRDLWNVVDTLSPGRFGSFFKYAQKFCNTPEAPIWMGDCTFKPLGEIQVGDEVIGWDTGGKGRRRRLVRTKVVAVHRHVAPIVKVTLASGKVIRCTADHRWLSGKHWSRKDPWVCAKVGRKLVKVVDIPETLPEHRSRIAAWLGGMFDGEGCAGKRERGGYLTIAQSSSHNPDVCKELAYAFGELEIPFSTRHSDNKCDVFTVLGGKSERLKFLLWCRPVRRSGIQGSILGARFREASDEVVAIEPDGEGEVVGLTTETGNYVVWGLASKNCGAFQKDVRIGQDVKTVWDFDGRSNLEELRRRLSYFMLRRTHDDIALELPPRTRQVIELKVPAKNRLTVTRELSAKETRRALDLAADGKLKEVIAMIRQHVEDGYKVVAFCHRREVAEQVAEACGGLFIHGGITQAQRDDRIAMCRHAVDAGVLAATIDVASVGIDLSFASVAVFVELTWEPHELAQAEARLYRFGQTKPVLVQYTIALGTGEELIRDGVLAKLETIQEATGDAVSGLATDLRNEAGEADALRELWESLP